MRLLALLRRQDDRLRLGALILWCIAWLVVVWAMLDPAPPPFEKVSDKVVHFVSFFAVSAATVGFCRTARQFLIAGGFCAAAGVGLELAQQFTPPRAFEWGDIAANLTGTLAGITAAVLLLLVIAGIWRRPPRAAAGETGRRRAGRAARRPIRRPV